MSPLSKPNRSNLLLTHTGVTAALQHVPTNVLVQDIEGTIKKELKRKVFYTMYDIFNIHPE